MKKLKTGTINLKRRIRYKYGRTAALMLTAALTASNFGTALPVVFAAGDGDGSLSGEWQKAYETASSSNATATSSDAEEVVVDEEFLADDLTAESLAGLEVPAPVSVLEEITVTFHSNGGSGAAPDAVNAGEGETIELPDYDGTKAEEVFVGWCALSNPHASGAYAKADGAIYPAGTEYTVPSKDATLYAVWAKKDVDANFFVRLDGSIPTEPQNHPIANYTKGIAKSGAIQLGVFYTDSSEGVECRLNEEQMPTDEELAELFAGTSEEISFSDGTKYDKTTTAEQFGERYYVLWYVIKSEDGWHVDGALLKKDLVNLSYCANAPEGTWSNMPDGQQYPEDSTATVSDQKPVREGYEFLGWNTKPDGSGKAYAPGKNFQITENTTLYAQWEPKSEQPDPSEPDDGGKDDGKDDDKKDDGGNTGGKDDGGKDDGGNTGGKDDGGKDDSGKDDGGNGGGKDDSGKDDGENGGGKDDDKKDDGGNGGNDNGSKDDGGKDNNGNNGGNSGGTSGGNNDTNGGNSGNSSNGGSSSSGSHSSGGSSSGSSSSRSGGSSSGGPGVATVTIDPVAVPAADLPELPGTETFPVTSEEETTPAALPKTGQSRTNEAVFFLSGALLAAFAAGSRKRKEDDAAE